MMLFMGIDPSGSIRQQSRRSQKVPKRMGGSMASAASE
jgi:hypothetical protein